MKKAIFLILTLLLFATVAQGSPFLVTNPYPPTEVQPTYFLISIDGGASVKSLAVSADPANPGSYMLKYDLGGLAISPGTHNATIAACIEPSGVNMGGCSATVPFSFSNLVPAAPTGVKLVP